MPSFSPQQNVDEMESAIAEQQKKAEAEIANPETHDLGLTRMDLVKAHQKILEIVKSRNALVPADNESET